MLPHFLLGGLVDIKEIGNEEIEMHPTVHNLLLSSPCSTTRCSHTFPPSFFTSSLITHSPLALATSLPILTFIFPCSSHTPYQPCDRYMDLISPVICWLVAVCSTCYLNTNLDLCLLAARFHPMNNKIIRFISIWSQLLLLSRISPNIKATS